MTYAAEQGAVSARVHPLERQPTQPGVGTIVATGDVTHGEFGIFRGLMAPGSEIASHFHRGFSESFYPLSGQLAFYDGNRWADVKAGDLVHIPAGGIHGLKVVGDAPAEVLTIFVPGVARERFVLELLEIRRSGTELTPDEWAEFYRRHDQYMV